jgi:eukaryotic-like serine/threonine-protein kinase
VLDLLVAAGRGLAAAHAAGIVHRDFKPQNMMIAKDGGVRVMDFGLARLVAEGSHLLSGNYGAAASHGSESPPTITQVTETGALLGTPAYMAPEQFRGERADARSDQYSFSVALHEATYGERPQAGTPPPQTRSEAPAWLRRILQRGLDPEPAKRFDAMTTMLRAIGHGRTRPRGRALGIGTGLFVVLLVAGGWRLSHRPRFDCNPPADRIAAAWATERANDPRRLAVERALVTTGKTDALEAWRRISTTLDTYIEKWRAMYRETCEATHTRGEQSEEVLDLRMRCLNDSLDDVRALVDVLSTGAGPSTSQAVGAASSISPIGRCADIQSLRSAVPLPRDPSVLARVRELQRRLKDVRALYDIARLQDGLAAALDLRDPIEATGYSPLLGELLATIATFQIRLGLIEVAEAAGHEAIAVAEIGGDHVTAAQAATALSYLKGYARGRTEDGKRWAHLARKMVERAGPGHPRLRAWIEQDEAAIFFAERDFPSARTHLLKALSLKQEVLGPDHPDVAITLSDLGFTLARLHKYDEALRYEDRALGIIQRSGGVAVDIYNNRGETLRALGRTAEAKHMFEIAAQEEQGQREHANALTGLGLVHLDLHQPVEAAQFLERALRLREHQEPDGTLVAETRFGLARALVLTGGNRQRAVALAREARQACAKANLASEVSEIDEWLRGRANNSPTGPAGRADR